MAYLTYNGKYLRDNGKMLTLSIAPPDSVSTDVSEISFDGTGASLDQEWVQVYSSGTWTRSLVNTGDGTAWITSALPSSGASYDTCTVSVQSGYEGLGRSCILRFTVGSATADVTIQQYGYV
ncbi:BACON domain-containing protein [bacterium]|nr:BACON domain-containing protein [bacterium]